jgi:hypothetical protein
LISTPPADACPSFSIRLLLVELRLAVNCQHVPSRRHILKFLFVTRVHLHLRKFPTFFGEPMVFQYSLHDAISDASKWQVNIEPAASNRRQVEACFSTVFD